MSNTDGAEVRAGWRRIFGREYQVPQEITSLLRDNSHVNSLCPSFLVGTRIDGNLDYEVTLWVEHPDKKERTKGVPKEYQDVGCQLERFVFMRVENSTGECDYLLKTDSLPNALKCIETCKKYLEAPISKPICPTCGNRNMASQGQDIICDQCFTKCGEVQ